MHRNGFRPTPITANTRQVSEWKNFLPVQKRILIVQYTSMIQEKNMRVTAKEVTQIFDSEMPKVWVGFDKGKPFMRVHEDSIGELLKRLTDKLL